MFADPIVSRVAGNDWARLHCLAGGTQKRAIAKVAKIGRARAPAAAATACSATNGLTFKPPGHAARLSQEAQRHCVHPLCDGAGRTGCPPYGA